MNDEYGESEDQQQISHLKRDTEILEGRWTREDQAKADKAWNKFTINFLKKMAYVVPPKKRK